MATVYQRNKILNANLDKKQLSAVGEQVSAAFRYVISTVGAVSTRVKAEGPVFQVWDYSDDFTPVIDSIIKGILKPKRKRIDSSKVKI